MEFHLKEHVSLSEQRRVKYSILKRLKELSLMEGGTFVLEGNQSAHVSVMVFSHIDLFEISNKT